MKKSIRYGLLIAAFLLRVPASTRAQVVANVSQLGVAAAFPTDVNQPIVAVIINVGIPTYSLYNLFLSTGSSTAGIIDNARVFYTGISNTFSTATQYGPTVVAPNGPFSVGSGGPFPLTPGDNYFWVAYDVGTEADFCDTLDALCSSVYGSTGTLTPVPSDPPGYTVVGDQDCVTSVVNISATENVIVFPNPSAGSISIRTNGVNENILVRLFNTMGEELLETNETEIDLRHLPTAVYLVQVTKAGKNYSSRLAIMH